jgi:anion-transporting  ArsA/GET3 family ATPase
VSVESLLDGKRVVICAGAGGVGKTTTAAAIALGLARRGAKVAVVTIDPARRLAGALGLDQLDNEPRQIDAEHLAGIPIAGELWAMMLDPKRTFDDLIDAAAPSAARAQEIKANRIYRQLSTAVSGSQEFTAVAKLYELESSGQFDVIVLDTPPSRNALDFLDAPARLEAFIEGRTLKALLRPTGFGMRVFAIGASPMFAALKRVTGIDMLSDLTTFFSLLGNMTDSFDQRARGVDALLHAQTTGFIVITSPESGPTQEAIWLAGKLADDDLPFSLAVVNRVHDPIAEEPLDALPAPLAAKVEETLSDYRVLAARDTTNVEYLRQQLGSTPVLLVPELDGDVHDLAGLLAMHEELFR